MTERNGDSDDTDGIGRRDYIQGTATALAAATGVGVVSGAAYAQDPQVDASVSGGHSFSDNGDHYEYVVDPGERLLMVVEEGGTIQNVLIDITASGASASIVSQTSWDATPPSSYTIRNVGVEGSQPDDGPALFVTSCTDQATVENVYAGDGNVTYPVSSNWNDYPGCWRASLEHSGHLIMRDLYVSGWVDNALYMSPPADPGNGNGSFHVEDCYVVNNQISCYRFGTETTMVNCYGATQSGDHRVVWGYSNSNTGSFTIDVEDCSFDAAASHRALEHRGDANFVLDGNSEYSGENGDGSVSGGTQTSSPRYFQPSSVPTDPMEAATGESGGDGGDIVGDGDEFEIEGPGEFYFEVTGEVEPDPSIAEYADYGEHYGDDWVSFTLSDTGETHWWFTGDIVTLDKTDDQTAYINGQEYDDDDGDDVVIEEFERSAPLDEYGGETHLFDTTSSPVYEGSQALVNDGGDFGSLVSTSGLGDYPERGDEVYVYFQNASDDNFVAFHLFAQSETDNPDGYTVGISAAGAWRMWLNEDGDTDWIASEDLPASDQISGWYRAEIWTDSSTVYADLYDDSTDELLASISADDSTYDSGGIGFRSAGNGEVWDYVVYGGEGGTSDDYPEDRELIFDGEDSGSTVYSFEVDPGPVEASYSVDPDSEYAWISDDGTEAGGEVWGYVDEWAFDGHLVSVETDGPATVLLDDEEIDPDDY